MNQWTAFALLWTVPFAPLFLRERIARRGVDRMTRVAAGIWNEACARGQQDDPRVRHWHDAVIVMAAVAPHIASGLLDPGLTKPRRPVPVPESSYKGIDGLEWIIPYLCTAIANIGCLEFFGYPYKLNRWPTEILCGVLLALEDAQGDIKFAPARESAAKVVTNFARATDRVESYGRRTQPC